MAIEVRSDFKTLYCKWFECNPENYIQDILIRCFKLKVGIIPRILFKIYPKFFSRDIELVEKVGRATDLQHVDNAISNYFVDHGFKRNLLRDKLNLRLSCNKLQKIASQIFKVQG